MSINFDILYILINKSLRFVFHFKIREIILNCFKHENLGRGGLKSIDFDIPLILVYFLYHCQPVFNLGINIDRYGKARLSLPRQTPAYPPGDDFQVSI